MSILDIIILVLLLIAVVRGYKNGLVVEVLGMASVFIAGYAAYYLTKPIAAWWKGGFSYKEELVFVLIFIAFVIGVVYLARLISRLFDSVGLGVGDKIGGAVISLMKYIIIISVSLAIFMSINDKLELVSKKQMHETMLYDPMTKVTDYLFPYFKEAKEGLQNIKEEYFDKK